MYTNKLIKNSRNAFTMLEVLLAVFILEIGLLAIVGFYAYSMQITKLARNQTTAANLASGILDDKLDLNYENLALGTSSKDPYTVDSNSPLNNWLIQTSVTYIDDLDLSEKSTETNMKKIVVTVFWQEQGVEKSFQTASIKARH